MYGKWWIEYAKCEPRFVEEAQKIVPIFLPEGGNLPRNVNDGRTAYVNHTLSNKGLSLRVNATIDGFRIYSQLSLTENCLVATLSHAPPLLGD